MTITMTAGLVRSSDGTEIGYDTFGDGDGLIVLGGSWRSAQDYRRFARALAADYTVHVVDRRGRGQSGPQGPSYGIEQEVADVLAVQARTHAKIIFGHSYGGLVALEAARQSTVFSDVVAYEPGVSVDGSLPLRWVAEYRERLTAGDRRGAFAAMVRGAGGAPAALERMPLWYVKLMLRLFIKEQQWRDKDRLLETGLAEHEQVAVLADKPVDRYGTITAHVVLLGGRRSRPHLTTTPFGPLLAVIPDCVSEVIDGLDHLAPDEKAPEVVAERVRHQLAYAS
jgi:pimeloyl-ACP methyl ester carboxylesterase